MSSDAEELRKIAIINKERAIFLKQLSLEPEVHVTELAERLGLDSDRAWAYVRAFLKVLSQEYDQHNPQQLKKWVNLQVEPEFQLTDLDITNLVPLLDRYPDPSYKKAEELNKVIVEESMSSPPSTNNNEPSNNPEELNKIPGQPPQQPQQPTRLDEFGQPERPVAQDWGMYNVNSLNRTYDLSWLSQLNRIGLMRFVLQRVPVPPPTPRVEAFIQIFHSNEDNYMASPDTLRRELRDYFGEKTGEAAAHNFVNYIGQLPPIEQFGSRKAQGLRGVPAGQQPFNFGPANPFTAGSQFENPFDTYYHREGVLGFGMDARSPSAMRLIWEFEQQKRRDKEQERKRDKMMDDIRQSMQLQMADFMNQLKNGKSGGFGGGGGMDGMSQMFWPMMMTAMSNGRLRMEPFTDTDGRTQMRMVSGGTDGGNGHGFPDPDRITAKDLLTLMGDFYGKLDQRAQENQTLRDKITDNLLARIDDKKGFVDNMMDFKKLYQEIGGTQQGQGGMWGNANPLEIARVLLEKDKFVADRERADKALDRSFNEKKEMQAIDLEREKEANKTKNTMIKSVSTLVGTMGPTMMNLLLMLTGRQPIAGGVTIPGQGMGGGGGGGLGNIMNMLGSLFGGKGIFGGGGEEGEEGGGGGPGVEESPFGSMFKQRAQPQPQTQAGSTMGPSAASYSSVPEESFDIGDIMSSVRSMFGMEQPGQEQQSPPQQQQMVAPPMGMAGGMPFMGMGPGGPEFPGAGAYNRRPTVQTGMPANVFEEQETSSPPQQIFQVNTNLPPYQQQFRQQPPPQQYYQPQPQPQPQPEQQQQQQQEEFRIYSEQDFVNTPKERLQEFQDDAKKSLESIQSYLKSIQNVMGAGSSPS